MNSEIINTNFVMNKIDFKISFMTLMPSMLELVLGDFFLLLIFVLFVLFCFILFVRLFFVLFLFCFVLFLFFSVFCKKNFNYQKGCLFVLYIFLAARFSK